MPAKLRMSCLLNRKLINKQFVFLATVALFSGGLVFSCKTRSLNSTPFSSSSGANEGGEDFPLKSLSEQINSKVFLNKENAALMVRETRDLDEQAADSKWTESIKVSPLRFFRSYPNAYFAELTNVEAGPVALCFGDAHIENFGFVVFADGPHYVFNDFDDSGNCPIGLDVVRYLTSLKLYEDGLKKSSKDEDLLTEIVDEYADIVEGKGGRDAKELRQKLNDFDPKKDNEKNLKKFIKNNRFRLDDSELALEPVTQEEQSLLKAKLPELASIQNFEILDIVKTKKETGGSAGLTRYLVLTAKPKETSDKKKKDKREVNFDQEIFEVKTRATPGTYFGKWKMESQPDLATIKSSLWPGLKPIDHDEIELNGQKFLVRSKTKGSIDIEDVKDDQKNRKALYKAQIGIIATYHKPLWLTWSPDLFKGNGKKKFKNWLYTSSEFLASRYTQAYQAANEQK